jgi:hypothetical protein
MFVLLKGNQLGSPGAWTLGLTSPHIHNLKSFPLETLVLTAPLRDEAGLSDVPSSVVTFVVAESITQECDLQVPKHRPASLPRADPAGRSAFLFGSREIVRDFRLPTSCLLTCVHSLRTMGKATR